MKYQVFNQKYLHEKDRNQRATGAVVATIEALPQDAVKLDGIAVHVPVPISSISDIYLMYGGPGCSKKSLL
ncbi:MAG: hypothetical protein ABIN80_21240 [Dyadobacter sp.]|uniref:hypothetical protein n=1 Tax=Dyadobacter sp. TaxID=1914288 RepID=UPI003265DE9F